MKETEHNLKSALATPPGEGSGLISETRSLFDQLAGEVARRAEQDHADAHTRGPVAKALLVGCVAAGLLAAATLLFGVFKFPDAPIRETRSGYAGKTGAPRTRQDYQQFRSWEKAAVTTFALTFLTGFSAAAADRRNRRRRDPNGPR